MMPSTTTLMLTSIVAACAYQNEHIALYDEVSMLQTTHEVNRREPTSFEDGHVQEYEMNWNCATKKHDSVETVASSDTSLLAVGLEQPSATHISAWQEESADPTGAGELKLVLRIAVLAIILDGLRRKWVIQKPKASMPAGRANVVQQDSASSRSAWIAMVDAAKRGDTQLFMKKISPQSAVNQADVWGFTPLHFAAFGGSVAICKELLRLGADIDARDACDETPLHVAARDGNVSICELLNTVGADIDAVGKDGMTPLVLAGHSNQERVCRFLADCGAGVAGMADKELPPLVVSQLVRRVMDA